MSMSLADCAAEAQDQSSREREILTLTRRSFQGTLQQADELWADGLSIGEAVFHVDPLMDDESFEALCQLIRGFLR